jgi:osmotically-inducible protein OsmY
MAESAISVKQRVSEALLVSNRIGRAIIEVEDAGGIVTLRGMIESERDRLAAEALTRQQQGVIDVINDLEVSSAKPSSIQFR